MTIVLEGSWETGFENWADDGGVNTWGLYRNSSLARTGNWSISDAYGGYAIYSLPEDARGADFRVSVWMNASAQPPFSDPEITIIILDNGLWSYTYWNASPRTSLTAINMWFNKEFSGTFPDLPNLKVVINFYADGLGFIDDWKIEYTPLPTTNTYIRDGSIWKPAEKFVRHNNLWKPSETLVRHANIWKEV